MPFCCTVMDIPPRRQFRGGLNFCHLKCGMTSETKSSSERQLCSWVKLPNAKRVMK
jgi:hypothetical protein